MSNRVRSISTGGTVLLQARMGSSRLPGKILKSISGKPMLYYTLRCLEVSPAVNRVVVATSNLPKDDAVEEFCADYGCDCFRGSEDNVLERFYKAAETFPDNYYFRATGDNPVVDPLNPVRTIEYLIENNPDYCCESGMPVGTVVEAFTAEALERCYKEAKREDDKEHVTLLMKRDGNFSSEFFPCPDGIRGGELSLTVDYEEDFNKLSYIIETLYKNGRFPDFREIVQFVKNIKGESYE